MSTVNVTICQFQTFSGDKSATIISTDKFEIIRTVALDLILIAQFSFFMSGEV